MSFSFNIDDLLSSATTLFNSLWPIFAWIAGFGVGIGLVHIVISEVRKAF